MMGRRQSKMAPGVWDLTMEDRTHTGPRKRRKAKRRANKNYRHTLRAALAMKG